MPVAHASEWESRMLIVRHRLEALRPGRHEPFHALSSVTSTNQFLLDEPVPDPGKVAVCIAREQTAGRGRRGRRWLSAGESSLTFSLGRLAAAGRGPDTRLPLVAAVAVTRVLHAAGALPVGIKWPNDLLDRDSGAKLGGILIEGKPGLSGQPGAWVLGVGLNLSGARTLGLPRPVTDLEALLENSVDPEGLLAALVLELGDAWIRFEQEGFAPFLSDYAAADLLRGRRLMVAATGQEGIASGVEPDSGRLRLALDDGREAWVTGEIVFDPTGG